MPDCATAETPAIPGAVPAPTRGTLFRALGLFVAVAIAYLPVSSAGFIWDDDMYVVDNASLRDLPGLARIWFVPGATPQYYPAVFTTFWIEHHLWGLSPAGYHAVNVACHAAGAILLATFLSRLAVPHPWTIAWLFALHPVQVESVAWITERKNVLSFLLAVAAGMLLLPLLGLDGRAAPPSAPATRERLPWGRYAAALAVFALALASKSVVCSLPAVLLLVVWWKRGRIEGRDILLVAPFFALGIFAGLHTAALERSLVGASGEGFEFSLAERILIAGRVVVFYAWSLLWPHGLLFNYPRWSIDTAAVWQWAFPAAVAGVGGLTLALQRRIGRGAFAAYAAYVGILFPALGFVNVWPFVYSFVADHFQYHASPAFFTLIVATFSAVAAHLLPRLASAGDWRLATGALFVGLGLLTARQATVYRDLETLYHHTLAGNPRSFLAINNLANVFIDRGQYAAAVPLLHEAISLSEIASHRTLASVTLARVEGRLHRDRGDHTEAITAFTHGLSFLPNDPSLMLNIAETHQLAGDAAEAERAYRDLLTVHPRCAPAMISYGTLLSAAGRTAEAEKLYAASFQTAPSARAAYNLAVVLWKAGRDAEAIDYASRAVMLDPHDEDARQFLLLLKATR